MKVVNHRRSNKNVRKTKGTMRAGGTHRRDRKTRPIDDHNGRRKKGRWRVNRRKYIGVRSGVGPTGGLRAMVLKEWAKATWSQLAYLSHVDAGGAVHGVAEGNPREAPASMAAGGRGSPPGA